MPITINGSGTVTGISAGGLPDDCITTAEIAAAAVTTVKLGSSEASGLAKAVQFEKIMEYREGKLHWKVRCGARAMPGSAVGSMTKEYLRFKYNSKTYANHRVIFYLHHNWWPEEVDHINMDKLDNRIENLRAATKSQNQANSAPYKSREMKGSYLNSSGKYMAIIQKDKKRYYLGVYETQEGAAKAYADAAKKLHGDFARLTKKVAP
jgi:hypothetical protein